MKYYELNREEKQIAKDFETGALVQVDNVAQEKRSLKKYAKQTLGKTKNINIRLSHKDLIKLKSKAATKGIPYQTLASSILHCFTSS